MDDVYYVVLLLIFAALGLGIVIGLLVAPAYQPHPDVSKIERPLQPHSTADIERRRDNAG